MVYTTHLWENWRWFIIVLPTLHIIHMLRHLPYPPCQLGTQFHHYHHPGANKRRRAFNLRQFPSKMRYTPIWPYFIVEKIQTTVPISWRKKRKHHLPVSWGNKIIINHRYPWFGYGSKPWYPKVPKNSWSMDGYFPKNGNRFWPTPFSHGPAIPSEATPAAVPGPHCPRPALQRQWRCALAAHWAGWAGAAPHGWPLKAVNFSTKRRRFASQNPLLDKPIGVDHPQTNWFLGKFACPTKSSSERCKGKGW